MSERNEGEGGGLLNMIRNTAYSTVDADSSWLEPGSEALADDLASQEGAAADTSQSNVAAEPVVENVVTPGEAEPAVQPTLPVVDPRVAQLEAELLASNKRAEEALKFLALAAATAAENELKKIRDDPELSEAEKRAQIAEFKVKQLESQNKWLEDSRQQQVAQREEIEEQIAHRQVVNAYAQHFGVPFEHIDLLMMAPDEESLTKVAIKLSSMTKQQVEQQKVDARQQRVNSGVDVAGGVTTNPVAPAKPKERVGDLRGMLRSQQYQIVNVTK